MTIKNISTKEAVAFAMAEMWEATTKLRWIVPDCTTTHYTPKLQQLYFNRLGGGTEWRSVPLEVVSIEEFQSIKQETE